MKNIENGNCLIAEYMEGKLHSFFYQFPKPIGMKEEWDEGGFLSCGPSTCWNVDELQYHESYDWLMPVWFKIQNWFTQEFGAMTSTFEISSIGIYIKGMHTSAFKHANLIVKREVEIKDIWEAVVEFLEWYNKDKQKA